jgi:phosphate transport system substrate-binding protein
MAQGFDTTFFYAGCHLMKITLPGGRVRDAFTGLLVCLFLAACSLSHPSSTASSVLRGTVKIDGSTALQPLAAVAAQQFMQTHAAVQVSVATQDATDPSYDPNRLGSKNGLADVNNGKVDIGDSDIYADSSLSHYAQLNDHIVCIIPFALIVNPSVTNVKDLTTSQIVSIYAANTITNWAQVGGPNLAIKKAIRPSTSGTRATFRQFVLGGRDEEASASDNVLQKDSTSAILSYVAATPGAIGYVGLPSLVGVGSKVTQLTIDGVTPTTDTIKNNTYHFWNYEHMYTLGEESPLVSAFLSFMLGEATQRQAIAMQYVAISAIIGPGTTALLNAPLIAVAKEEA